MFDAARVLLLNAGHSYKTHAGVLTNFGLYFVKNGIVQPEIHRFLIDASQERQAADYYDEEISAARAKAQLHRAESFIETAKHLLNQPDDETWRNQKMR